MKELVLYRNSAVENNILNYVNSRVDYDTLSPKDKCTLLRKLECSCKSCDLHYSSPYSNVPSILNPEGIFLFIGRNPNKGEAQVNQIMPEGTVQGNTFRKYLEYMGIGQSEISVINMCNCYSKGNRPVTQEEINKCVAFRSLELDVLKSNIRVIFPMSQDALKWCFGLSHPGVMQCYGDVYETRLDDRPVLVIPLLHPSHICIDRNLAPEMEVVLKKHRQLIDLVRKCNWK